VLQVLEEEDIPVHMMAGTSIGGLVASLYGAGIPLSDLMTFGAKFGIMDLASPDRKWQGLFGQAKLADLLADLLGGPEVTFEDLEIPLAVTATDLETKELVILDTGPLIPALMATAAFPLFFSPVHYRSRWLVDGGVLNNYPVDIVRQMGADRVLGVQVPPSIQLPLREEKDRGLSPRGLSILTSLAREWKLPFLIAESSVSISIAMITHTRTSLSPPDLAIDVELPNVGVFTSDSNVEIIAAGRTAAKDRLEELERLKSRPFPPRWRRRLARELRRLRRAWTVYRQPEYPLFPGQCIRLSDETGKK
jgi:NTE family protein